MNTKTKRLRKHRKSQIGNRHSMAVTARRFLSLILWTVIVSPVMPYASAQDVSEPVRQSTRSRRVLYNFDGDSCLSTKAGSKGPVPVNIDDVKRLIEEVAYEGSRVDTVLVCINAQVTYYPTKVGTMRGTLSTPEERAKWPESEKQRFKNLKTFFDAGVDPYAVMLAKAKRRGCEALLTFRMNESFWSTMPTGVWAQNSIKAVGRWTSHATRSATTRSD